MGLNHEDRASLASSLQSPDCPLRELHLGVIRVYDGDLNVVLAALRGPHCKLETLRSVPVEESSHSNNPVHIDGHRLSQAEDVRMNMTMLW